MKPDARPLNEEERRLLGVLLQPKFDGVRELREQATAARVVGRCDCGCPTVHPWTDGPPARAMRQRRVSPVEGRIAPEHDEPPGEILLFLQDDRLASMEYVYFTDSPPDA